MIPNLGLDWDIFPGLVPEDDRHVALLQGWRWGLRHGAEVESLAEGHIG